MGSKYNKGAKVTVNVGVPVHPHLGSDVEQNNLICIVEEVYETGDPDTRFEGYSYALQNVTPSVPGMYVNLKGRSFAESSLTEYIDPKPVVQEVSASKRAIHETLDLIEERIAETHKKIDDLKERAKELLTLKEGLEALF